MRSVPGSELNHRISPITESEQKNLTNFGLKISHANWPQLEVDASDFVGSEKNWLGDRGYSSGALISEGESSN